MEKLKNIDKGTLIRTILQVLVYINQIVALIGQSSYANALWYQIVTVVLTILITVFTYWYNNDWSNFALLTRDVFDMLKDGKITSEEMNEFINKHKIVKKEDMKEDESK